MPKQAKKRPKKKQTTSYLFPVLIEKDEDGYYACCPSLQGCSTQGDSYEEALANIREAVEVYLESLRDDGEEIPQNEVVLFTTIEVRL